MRRGDASDGRPGQVPKGRRSGATRRATGLLLASAALPVVAVLSLAIGARSLSLGQVWQGLTDPHAIGYVDVRELRLPRTVLALLVGAALGIAGGVMQTVTRNPLADPGLLGINAGASCAVVSAITFAGVTSLGGYMWFAFAGAGAVTAVVWGVAGGRRATPARLVLAGMAVNAALYAYVNGVELLDTGSLDQMRFWTVGSLASVPLSTAGAIAPLVAAGMVLTAVIARPLNALALGDESAGMLGARPAVTRVAAIVVVTLLCGAATAACGPILFVGLMAPHLVCPLTGPDVRWLLPYCAVVAPLVLLGADIVGRVIARPGEIEVGVVTAVLGGPVFVYLARRRRLVAA